MEGRGVSGEGVEGEEGEVPWWLRRWRWVGGCGAEGLGPWDEHQWRDTDRDGV